MQGDGTLARSLMHFVNQHLFYDDFACKKHHGFVMIEL